MPDQEDEIIIRVAELTEDILETVKKLKSNGAKDSVAVTSGDAPPSPCTIPSTSQSATCVTSESVRSDPSASFNTFAARCRTSGKIAADPAMPPSGRAHTEIVVVICHAL